MLDDQGRPVSLLRVAEITGKQIPFEKCDVCDINQLEEIFKKVNFFLNALIRMSNYSYF